MADLERQLEEAIDLDSLVANLADIKVAVAQMETILTKTGSQ